MTKTEQKKRRLCGKIKYLGCNKSAGHNILCPALFFVWLFLRICAADFQNIGKWGAYQRYHRRNVGEKHLAKVKIMVYNHGHGGAEWGMNPCWWCLDPRFFPKTAVA
jgi:hypothetical protein